MSGKIFFKVWNSSRQVSTRLLVLLAIADECNDLGRAKCSRRTLARKAKISIDQCWRITQAIAAEENPEITIIHGESEGEWSTYQINLDNLGSHRGHAVPTAATRYPPPRPRGTPHRADAVPPHRVAAVGDSLDSSLNPPQEIESSSSSSSSNTQTTHDDDDDERVVIFRSAGTPKANIKAALKQNPSQADILAHLARAYELHRVGKVRRPELIAAMNIAKGDTPPAQFYQPEYWERHIPADILNAAGIEPPENLQPAEPQQTIPVTAAKAPAHPETPAQQSAAWIAVLDALDAQLAAPLRKSLAQTTLLPSQGDTLRVACQDHTHAEYLASRLTSTIQRLLPPPYTAVQFEP